MPFLRSLAIDNIFCWQSWGQKGTSYFADWQVPCPVESHLAITKTSKFIFPPPSNLNSRNLSMINFPCASWHTYNVIHHSIICSSKKNKNKITQMCIYARPATYTVYPLTSRYWYRKMSIAYCYRVRRRRRRRGGGRRDEGRGRGRRRKRRRRRGRKKLCKRGIE